MFRKILYPTDFSEGSKRTIDYLIEHKDAGIEEVVILHVIDTRNPLNRLEKSLMEEKQRLEAKDKAAGIAERLNKEGIATQVIIKKGIPHLEIQHIASGTDITLIVIGSRGTGNVQEMLLGSVSEKVVKSAQKPVLVVKR